MPLNKIDQEVFSMISKKQALNEAQKSYDDLQRNWSKHLAELVKKLLEEKRKAYKPDPSKPNEVNWDMESESSLIKLYEDLQKVESGYTNREEYKYMSKEDASLMMGKYGLMSVQSDLKDEELEMSLFLKQSVLPKIAAYQAATTHVQFELIKAEAEAEGADKIKVYPDTVKKIKNFLSFVSVLGLNLVVTPEYTTSDTRLSVKEMWDKSIQICQVLGGDIGNIFQRAVIQKVATILYETPPRWSDDVFKYVFTNVSSIFCIKTSEDMGVVMESADVQKFLLDNKAAIESNKFATKRIVRELDKLKEHQKKPTKWNRFRANERQRRLFEAWTMTKDMQEDSRQALQNNAYLAVSVASAETSFACALANEYATWIKSKENEVIDSLFEELAT